MWSTGITRPDLQLDPRIRSVPWLTRIHSSPSLVLPMVRPIIFLWQQRIHQAWRVSLSRNWAVHRSIWPRPSPRSLAGPVWKSRLTWAGNPMMNGTWRDIIYTGPLCPVFPHPAQPWSPPWATQIPPTAMQASAPAPFIFTFCPPWMPQGMRVSLLLNQQSSRQQAGIQSCFQPPMITINMENWILVMVPYLTPSGLNYGSKQIQIMTQ